MSSEDFSALEKSRDMFQSGVTAAAADSNGQLAHFFRIWTCWVGCDSSLQIVMAFWRFFSNLNLLGWVWQLAADSKGLLAHFFRIWTCWVGCDSPLQIEMAVWRNFFRIELAGSGVSARNSSWLICSVHGSVPDAHAQRAHKTRMLSVRIKVGECT